MDSIYLCSAVVIFLVVAAKLFSYYKIQTFRKNSCFSAALFTTQNFSHCFLDTSRSSQIKTKLIAKHRRLKTQIWLPKNSQGPCPLVIYSHGLLSERFEAELMAEYLASRGYIVASIQYPSTSIYSTLHGGPDLQQVMEQPKDIRFIIDSLLLFNNDTTSRLHQRIDTKKIAAAGVSLGGMTTNLAFYHKELNDPRIQAAVSIAGPTQMFRGEFFKAHGKPFLMLAASCDAIIDHQKNAQRLLHLSSHIDLATLKKGSHTGFASAAALHLNSLRNPDKIGCAMVSWAIGEHLKNGIEFDKSTLNNMQPIEKLELGPTTDNTMEPTRQLLLSSEIIYRFLNQNLQLKPSLPLSALNEETDVSISLGTNEK